MKSPFVFVLLGAGLLAACSSPRLVGNDRITVVDAASMPAPTRADLAAAERPYVIGPFDKVAIDVFAIPDLSRQVQTDSSGRISLPLIGVLEAAGHTPAELASMIEAKLRDRYVRDPQVTVNLTDTVSQVMTVDGEVREPGLYPVIGNMTLMRAVATAKGVTEFAKQQHVVVFRSVDNKQLATLHDLRSIRNGLYDDPEIFANDVIVVGESRARRLFRDVIQGSGLITAPIVALVTTRN